MEGEAMMRGYEGNRGVVAISLYVGSLLALGANKQMWLGLGEYVR